MKGAFAATGHQVTRQRTLQNGTRIKSRNRTSYGNHNGFNVWVNGQKFFVMRLSRTEAEQIALERYRADGHWFA